MIVKPWAARDPPAHSKNQPSLRPALQTRTGRPDERPVARAVHVEQNRLANGSSIAQPTFSNNVVGTGSRKPHSFPLKATRRKRLRVAVDVDEVLGRFLHSLNKYCFEEDGSQYDICDYKEYNFAQVWGCSRDEANHRVHEFFKSHHFAVGILPIPGALHSLQRLKESCELVVVTSRQHVIRQPTLQWIQTHFPDVFQEVHFGNHWALSGESRKKSVICRDVGASVLIDDNPHYAIDCAEAGLKVLLYDWQLGYPWAKTADGPNHPLIRRVRDWNEVEVELLALASQVFEDLAQGLQKCTPRVNLAIANGTQDSVKTIVDNLNAGSLSADVDVVVAPTFVHIPYVQANLKKEVLVAAQNCWLKGPGAYTGEISAEILVDLGLKWVILGHSERRALLKESSEVVADKTKYALSKGLGVILCVGETLDDREANKTNDVVVEQLSAVASKTNDWSNIVIAYEPVWAIGTGKVATPQQAEEVHDQIRTWLQKTVSKDAAQATRVIYGGSVSAKNSKELAQCPNIDGFLVGGASLKPEFVDIINSKA